MNQPSPSPTPRSPTARTLPVSYFHEMYAASDDPWGFADRWYERRKYALTLASLSSERYGRVFEPGCSIGVLSAELVLFSDQLLCMDVSPRAVELAQRRLAHHRGRAAVVIGDLLHDWPSGHFDLIVLSEVLYYLEPAELDEVIRRLPGSLHQGGEVVAVHWRRKVAEYPQSGDDVHERLLGSTLHRQGGYADADFRLDVLTVDDRVSVAEREDLVS
ncbi:class I SAM-dependent DNA methyltransferase [Gordonia insulae]|uniref:Magnesium-protoporphyrin O-methyltransferase n=1 Tax=Gordonia insulae TaxID=2420509 RepID=A0A3G8JQX5_9ACTN|nr:class I SAM-dependent methyltransferase [Gordonia insulae]AZG46862.1 Magnesium-protoporphyrin O-methyltransferase [Gordonia insulae]